MGGRIDKQYEVLEDILAGVVKPRDLPLALLEDITDNFSEERKIGEGGFGTVYKGVLQNQNIAVKKIFLNKYTVDERLFRREVESLMVINNHPNLVRFLGFCSNTARVVKEKTGSKQIIYPQILDRLLCFEYISNGSLDKHITDELRGLKWDTRFDIIRGICEGLCYLHEDKRIIHMDLKPANILLDDHRVPKITDFGMSRSAENTHTKGERFGTIGYWAPEYQKYGDTSDRADIYSLGVIIVELVTGNELRGLIWDTCFDIIRGICEGLRYLHEDKSIIHMDLKPANILLDDHMVPKNTDFGKSRFAENTRTQGERFFTRGYCAPEYLKYGQTSNKADIYSLGVIIIELVTGSKHIPDETHVLRRWRHRWNKPPTQHQYQPVIKCMEIVVHCSEQEPGNRPSISDIICNINEIGSTNWPIGQMSLYQYDAMLGIEPLELRFPLEHNKQTSCLVELTNETINSIAFNIQTPSKQYSTWPDKGIVLPGRKCDVKITLEPQESATQVTNADKFIVQSTQVQEGLANEDIIDHMFNSKGGKVDEVSLIGKKRKSPR